MYPKKKKNKNNEKAKKDFLLYIMPTILCPIINTDLGCTYQSVHRDGQRIVFGKYRCSMI
jgi:hypothetical protein